MPNHQAPATLANLALTLAITVVLTGAFHSDARAQRKRTPPPPPPADSNLQLASTGTTGQAIDGKVCGVSADGGQVIFQTRNGSFEPDQIFLKDFNGNRSTRVVAGNPVGVTLACLAMTPDAQTVVFVGNAPNGVADDLGRVGSESAIISKNLLTGVETRITPMLSTLPGASSFRFAGVSDDGQRVAFMAEPTATCRLYDCVATGPARMFVRNLSTGELINLDSQVRLSTTQGRIDGNALISPDGQKLAFATRTPYPELGDGNANRSDVFVLNLASNAMRMLSTDANGQQVTLLGFASTAGGPSFGVQAFLSGSSRVAFRSATDLNVGPANVHAKDLNTGALMPLMPIGFSVNFPNVNVNGVRADLSFSDDGQKVAYVRRSNINPSVDIPLVLDLRTGVSVRAATLGNGTQGNGPVSLGMLLSRDGRVTAFDNNSTNLVAGASTSEVRTYRRLLP